MSWSSFPAGTPAWLLRHPLLLGRWIAFHRHVARATGNQRTTTVVAALFLVVAMIVTLATTRSASAWVQIVNHYWVIAFVIATLHATSLSTRRLRTLERHWPNDWLAAVPVTQRKLRVTLWLIAAGPVVMQCLAACVALLLLGVVERNLAGTLLPLAALLTGSIIGTLATALLPSSRAQHKLEASRYAPTATRSTASWSASTAALASWPVARAISTGRPENSRVLFLLVASFAVQAGTSAVQGLAIIGMWFLAAYLASLLGSMVSVAREASIWLRSTPIGFASFAWPLAGRTLLHQFLGTALAVGGVGLAGTSWGLAIELGISWLALVAAVSVIALADSYRTRHSLLKLGLAAIAIAGLGLRSAMWSISAALMIMVWHVRAGVKHP